MIKTCLLLAAIWGLISCSNDSENKSIITNIKIEDDYKPAYNSSELNNKFNISIDSLKTFGIDAFMAEWNKTIKPNSEDFINQNDTMNAVFSIYREFYKPLDLLKLGDWEWGNKLNSKSKYIVIQNKVFYSVLSTNNLDDYDWKTSKRDSIVNFRPPVKLEKIKTLYLTDEYAESINIFLGTLSTVVGEDNIMSLSKPKEESEKRYEMLRSYIPILHGHWGGYWHLETHPNVSIIILNKTLTKAKIDFRVGYQGGETILQKKGADWVIKESKATWIE
jgi:hypothetical protein